MAAINSFTNKPYSVNYGVLREKSETLPVSQHMPRLLASLQAHNAMVLIGETGSGKTTQFPKAIVQAGISKKRLAVTQTHSLAAQLLAERIAEEMDVQSRDTVGVRYRGCNSTKSTTRLEVLTDDILFADAKADPYLRAYDVVIVDDAQQHTVPTDLLLGLLKGLAEKRKDDLKIIIMSAAINAAMFANFFPGSVVETVTGREHKVSVEYLTKTPSEDGMDTIVKTILQIHQNEISGNILVFASGVREIFQIISGVEDALKGYSDDQIGPLACYPLHAQMSSGDQDKAVESVAPRSKRGSRKFGRKLIVATNIAETSVTLIGFTHVVDSLRIKSKIWNCEDESWLLRELWVSKAAAVHRAGRAGRTRNGKAWRMCTQAGFVNKLKEQCVPAILETDMLSECLDILGMGRSPIDFPYIVAPASETIVKAFDLLHELGALNLNGQLTLLGEAMDTLPLDAYSAGTLLLSPRYGCSDEMVSLISMIEASEGGSHLFIQADNKAKKKLMQKIRAQFQHASGDHLTLLNVYTSWKNACLDGTEDEFVTKNRLYKNVLETAERIRKQLLLILTDREGWTLSSMTSTAEGHDSLLKALAAGNRLRVAKRESLATPTVYQTIRRGIWVELSGTNLGPASASNEWVIYNELHNESTSRNFIRLVSAIPPEFLLSGTHVNQLNVESLPKGHIQDALVKLVARMTV